MAKVEESHVEEAFRGLNERIKEEFVRRYLEYAKPPSDLSREVKQSLMEDAKEKANAILRIIEKLGFELKIIGGGSKV